jgi:hypothetical protein
MYAQISAELRLGEPDADAGLVTWFDILIVEPDEQGTNANVGEARAALVHVGEALKVGEDLWCVLDADSGSLEALYSVYFDKDGFREEFAAGKGSDLLFFEDIEVKAPHESRNIELALVRRLCDSVGVGCELAVIEAATEAEAARWQRMGFELTQLGSTKGFMHLNLSRRRPRIVETDDRGAYRVVPNPVPGDTSAN